MRKIEEVVNESKPTVIVLLHEGKQDTEETAKLINELSNMYKDTLNIITLDTTRDGKMSMRYHVKDYPTYILFKEGQELMRESGKKSIADLDEMVKRAL